MFKYYALIIIAVIMFGGCFKLSDVYRKLRGSGAFASLSMCFISSAASILPLMMIGGFDFTITPFTLIMACAGALNSILFTYCSIMALGKINLSLYALFSMLGGMVLPFVQGILFFGEPLTVAKAVCLAFIIAALVISVKPEGKGMGGAIYYIGIFTLNGMSGVISKIFVSAEYAKASSEAYSMWGAIVSASLSGVIILVLILAGRSAGRESWLSVLVASGNGVTNKIANLFLVISLGFVDSSLQYPLVTGGVMIVSALISLLDREKKVKMRELVSVAVAFVGTLALFAIPI